jgi:hypothetical protein
MERIGFRKQEKRVNEEISGWLRNGDRDFSVKAIRRPARLLLLS